MSGAEAEASPALRDHYGSPSRSTSAPWMQASPASWRACSCRASPYYTWVVKVDAHNLMQFLRLRMAPEAQYEIASTPRRYSPFFAGAALTAEALSASSCPLGPLPG